MHFRCSFLLKTVFFSFSRLVQPKKPIYTLFFWELSYFWVLHYFNHQALSNMNTLYQTLNGPEHHFWTSKGLKHVHLKKIELRKDIERTMNILAFTKVFSWSVFRLKNEKQQSTMKWAAWNKIDRFGISIPISNQY